MATVLRISDAASLGLHTMVLLASNTEKLFTTREISELMSASKDHLSKVLQRLENEGYLTALRGPKGGYKMTKTKNDITLLDIYELFDGPLEDSNCLLRKPLCDGKNCILGGLLRPLNNQVRDYLATKKLSDLSG